MKWTITLIIFLLLPISSFEYEYIFTISLEEKIEVFEEKSFEEKVLLVFFLQESNLDTLAYNKTEEALGILQIRPVMLEDANRILGEEKFKLEDRLCVEKSVEMFWIIQNYYNPNLDLELAAHIWNGGPAKIKSRWKFTEKYRNEIIEKFNNI